MARATRDPASKATWNRMAERWLQCAERAKNQKFRAARSRSPEAAGQFYFGLLLSPAVNRNVSAGARNCTVRSWHSISETVIL